MTQGSRLTFRVSPLPATPKQALVHTMSSEVVTTRLNRSECETHHPARDHTFRSACAWEAPSIVLRPRTTERRRRKFAMMADFPLCLAATEAALQDSVA